MVGLLSMRLLALAIALLSASSDSAAGEPRRRRVHIDHLDPARVSQYEQARREWLEWIVGHRAVDPWGGLFLQVDGSTFMALRPFARFAELDPVPAPVPIDPRVQARYNERSDAALVPPHHNEIWLRQPELDYQPPQPVSEGRCAGRIVFEQARNVAGGRDEYLETWRAIRAELGGANHPVARITYSSQFGTGQYVSLWVAPSREAFAKAPSLEQVLAGRLGKEKAAKLLERWRASVSERQEHDVVARPDLSNREFLSEPAR
jgi:hypothetical protein